MWVIVPYMDDTFNFHLASVPSRINGRRHPSTLAWLTSTQILFNFFGRAGAGNLPLGDKKKGTCKSNKVVFLGGGGKDDAN